MNLPDGIKHAVHMGANEFVEWLSVDPSEEELENLGATYQSVGEDAAPPDAAKQYIADLKAWDDGDTSQSPGAKFESMMYTAGIEFARGLIAAAAGVGTVPDRVKPHMAELTPLVDELKTAFAEGSFDEEKVDLAAIIWGSSEDDDDDDDDDEGDEDDEDDDDDDDDD
ncbi:MAG TPA: hypothetical protein VMZ53_32805 [Kofleriaceae bacterium]|nr:hypothetical protein [Kofleriaceae bacterium]